MKVQGLAVRVQGDASHNSGGVGGTPLSSKLGTRKSVKARF